MVKASKKELDIIRRSKFFDGTWYLNEYPDVKILGMDPAEHYIWLGARIGRNPSPNFNGTEYLRRNPDVAAKNSNPLLHFIKYGAVEGV